MDVSFATPQVAPRAAPTPFRFYQQLAAFELSAALKSALDLDFFTAVAEGHGSPEALAARCSIAVRSARILGDYLTIHGYLEKRGVRYAPTPKTALFLDRHSPTYAGDVAEFLLSPHVQDQFAALTERLRTGGAPPAENMLQPQHAVWVQFAKAMANHHALSAHTLARRILAVEALRNRPLRILDIAAGHGLYGIAFALQHSQARITAQDWPNVLAVALENADKACITDRYSTLPGNAFEVLLGSGYDLALIPNFLHHFDIPTNTGLLRRVCAALAPAGQVVTVEFAPDEDRINPPAHGAFALYMLATTPKGDVYTVAEIAGMYREAGLQDIRAFDLGPGMQRVIIGTA